MYAFQAAKSQASARRKQTADSLLPLDRTTTSDAHTMFAQGEQLSPDELEDYLAPGRQSGGGKANM